MKLNELKMNAINNEFKNNELSLNPEKHWLPGILLLFAGISETHRMNQKSNAPNPANTSPDVENSHLHQCINCGFLFLCKFENCLVKSQTKTRFSLCETCLGYTRSRKNLGLKEN